MSKTLMWVFVVGLGLSLFACGSDDEPEVERYTVPIEGTLTVDPDLDPTRDYSGIHVRVLTIYQPETDTLYHAVTDTLGRFSGKAEFAERGEYLLEIRRRGNEIAALNIILAENDTIRIESELPDFDPVEAIDSREFKAMYELERLLNQFTRVSTYISAGLVDEDEALQNLHTWNDLFMEHGERYPGTLSADRAIIRAIGILVGWDEEKMFDQLAADPDNEALVEAGIYHGVPAKIRSGGLEEGLSFMDTLWTRSRSTDNRKLIGMNRIEMLYDSARVELARDYFSDFQDQFGDEPGVQNWITSVEYDLYHLAPGMDVPSFSIPLTNGGTLDSDELSGGPFIIEFVNFESPDYQLSYPRLSRIYDQFSEEGMRVVTIPTHDSQSTIDGFFSEREKKWDVAAAGVYTDEDLIETFNVDQIPVRLLINAEGRIVRKYYEPGIDELEADVIQQRHQTEIL